MHKKGGITIWTGLAALLLLLGGCASTGEQGPGAERADEADAGAQQDQGAQAGEGAEREGAQAQGMEGGAGAQSESLEGAERGAGAEAAEETAEPEVTEPEEHRIFFAFDSSELTDEARKLLRSHAEYLQNNGDVDVALEGHADERGSREYNLALGERRAKSVRRILLVQGVDSERLEVVSYGEERPLVDGHNEEAYAKNRRVMLRYKQ
ncbi:peptidoglycan-associated lipoprotein Pal [Thiohalorhabdus methylotrophus]|uniref:Peptidoglycan-associated lipoprotein n=1 Tax=Thiohalorhabdus methylotrophus TaxID=3242694 RepID=A0ABV4TR93_9GAMM